MKYYLAGFMVTVGIALHSEAQLHIDDLTESVREDLVGKTALAMLDPDVIIVTAQFRVDRYFHVSKNVQSTSRLVYLNLQPFLVDEVVSGGAEIELTKGDWIYVRVEQEFERDAYNPYLLADDTTWVLFLKPGIEIGGRRLLDRSGVRFDIKFPNDAETKMMREFEKDAVNLVTSDLLEKYSLNQWRGKWFDLCYNSCAVRTALPGQQIDDPEGVRANRDAVIAMRARVKESDTAKRQLCFTKDECDGLRNLIANRAVNIDPRSGEKVVKFRSLRESAGGASFSNRVVGELERLEFKRVEERSTRSTGGKK